MKNLCMLLFLQISISSHSQNTVPDTMKLSIAPGINQQDIFNRQIIATLKLFLNSKDNSYSENKYWSRADFKKYNTPYAELQGIETGGGSKNYYQPSLMEILETKNKDKKIVKIGFIGHDEKTQANIIKAIFNIVATQEEKAIVFSSFMNYFTEDWKEYKEHNILYKISPLRTLNPDDVKKEHLAELELCRYLNLSPLPITYFSCVSPKELFEVLGFDYHQNMYSDTSGGRSLDNNIVISANNSEYYLHEITHIYLRKAFPYIHPFFNEGFATYIGGSGKYSYQWQRDKLIKFISRHPDFNFAGHINDPYERLYFEHETPVPYLIAALVCERTLRLYGKEKLFELFRSSTDIFTTLRTVGLGEEDINKELLKQLEIPAHR